MIVIPSSSTTTTVFPASGAGCLLCAWCSVSFRERRLAERDFDRSSGGPPVIGRIEIVREGRDAMEIVFDECKDKLKSEVRMQTGIKALREARALILYDDENTSILSFKPDLN